MLDKILSVIAPHNCLGCGLEGNLLCSSCLQVLPPAVERCYKCQKLSQGGITCPACRRKSKLSGVQPATIYSGSAKELVKKLKFDGAKSASATIAQAMLPLLTTDEGLLVPIPTATSHVRQRGYDQTKLIAKELSSRSSMPLSSCLVRMGQQKQVGSSRVQRASQLAEAFRMANFFDVAGQRIILIDDVITTGSTLEVAAGVLKDAGAKQISALVFAQA